MEANRYEAVDPSSPTSKPHAQYPGPAIALFLILVAIGIQSYVQHADLKTEIVRERERVMQSATNEWMSQGMKTTVTTVRLSGETTADFAASHRAAVDEMLKVFPRDT